MMLNLKERAEYYLGGEIQLGEYEEAERSARRKLEWIIGRYGAEDRDDDYLAILISENVRVNRFQDHLELYQQDYQVCCDAEKCRKKEKAATRATDSLSTFILLRPDQFVKMEELF